MFLRFTVILGNLERLLFISIVEQSSARIYLVYMHLGSIAINSQGRRSSRYNSEVSLEPKEALGKRIGRQIG